MLLIVSGVVLIAFKISVQAMEDLKQGASIYKIEIEENNKRIAEAKRS